VTIPFIQNENHLTWVIFKDGGLKQKAFFSEDVFDNATVKFFDSFWYLWSRRPFSRWKTSNITEWQLITNWLIRVKVL
jgi:hypothetical protein